MKNILLAFIILVATSSSYAQDSPPPVSKGDYKILKLDVLNFIGLGVQKIHLGYEVSPMKANKNNLPTIQLNVIVPFNSLLEDLDIDYGVEGGAELRFYVGKKNRKTLTAEGFYMGAGLDGGYLSFSSKDKYYTRINRPDNREIVQKNDYTRVRTGIYFLMGGQSKLGDKLFFDINMGLGWSNVNVKESSSTAIKDYTKTQPNTLFRNMYNEGKSQRFYMPLSFGLGYNFGNR